jgi:short-subunit dehydrogenase
VTTYYYFWKEGGCLQGLKGKTILITGASRGIGAAVSMACAKQGATVILTARNRESLTELENQIKADGGHAVSFPFDQTDEDQLQQNLSSITGRFEKIDAVINNAGAGHWSSITETSLETWDQLMNINVRSVFLICKHILPFMYERKEGHIINISSVMANRGAKNLSVYCASKAALEGFTKSLYVEAKPYNVKITSLLPSQVDTGFRDNMKERRTYTEEEKSEMLKPEDVADSVIWLLNTSPTAFPVSFTLEMKGEQ